jgi:HD superfamily phosphohydrolase
MLVYDNIHGYIKLKTTAKTIVDTPIFQRLRNIHQTGILYLVFPTANHTRFEHSLGTYHLATKMIEKIANDQPELNITQEIIELVGIAGLCHDLGHLLFSHLFDDCFLNLLPNINDLKSKTKNTIHENRSIFLLNHLIEKYNVNLNKDQLKVIGDLINPKEAEYSKWKSKYQIGKWIFQIVSNPLNSIDVDKFDYLVRDTQATGLKFSFDYSRIIQDAKVIDNKICYSSQCAEDIYQMFFIRYRLHRQIYNHKAVKAIEILVIKLLFELEKEMGISQYILDADKMLELVDSFIWHNKINNKIKEIINDIETRKIPIMVHQDISLQPREFNESNLKEHFDPNSYYILRFKVGYVGGKTNPLNKVHFYNLKNGKIISENKVRSFSMLITQKHQECFLRVYCLNLDMKNNFIEYFENFNKNQSETICNDPIDDTIDETIDDTIDDTIYDTIDDTIYDNLLIFIKQIT